MSVARGRRGGGDGPGSAGRRVMLLGGTSEIGLAIVRALQLREPRDLALLGRDAGGLEREAQALRTDGAERVHTVQVDALDLERHEPAIAEAFDALGGCDIAVLAVGVLGARGAPEAAQVPAAVEVLHVNTVGAGSLLMHLAARMRAQGAGHIVVLSSAAAERPRASVTAYGASKAGLDALAQALGDGLRATGVRMHVIRPGFVRTRMTAGLDAAPLATTADAVAAEAVSALDRGAHTAWAPRALHPAMLAVRMLPRALFRRLEL